MKKHKLLISIMVATAFLSSFLIIKDNFKENKIDNYKSKTSVTQSKTSKISSENSSIPILENGEITTNSETNTNSEETAKYEKSTYSATSSTSSENSSTNEITNNSSFITKVEASKPYMNSGNASILIPSSNPSTNTSTNTSTNSNHANSSNPNSNTVSDNEKKVLELVNEIRVAKNLTPFTLNEKLSYVARIKSQDMLDKGYFSHTSPTYGSPFDMMKQFGIQYRTAGENIAMGYATPQAVVDGWMNSEGHRANILNASFTQMGIGHISNGNYWTQMFIG